MEAELERSLATALQSCGRARTYDDLCAAFDVSLRPLLERALRAPLAQSVRDDVSPDAAAPQAAALRHALERAGAGDDVWFLLTRAAAALLGRAAGKRERGGAGAEALSALVVGAFVLFAGRAPPALDAMRLTWAATLRRERARVEASAAHANANAAERRRAMLHGVLAVFSERAHRHYFTALWLPCMRHAAQCALHLHILHRAGDAILPHLTNPLVAADYLSGCFASGGLIAVLALRGIFVLMLDHGLEYPQFYTQLYSLVTADALASRHRYDLFRLLDLSLASARVPAYVAAAFAKRITRVALLAPTPVLYFVLPFVRRLLQRHPNCTALIHRGAREAIVGDEEAEMAEGANEKEKDLAARAKEEALRHAAALFDGTDPFDAAAPPEQCRALQSTLWELTALERHIAPAVPLMVAAFASTAEDTAPLRVEKTYARLFTAEVTRPISRTNMPTVAYGEPSEADDKDALIVV